MNRLKSIFSTFVFMSIMLLAQAQDWEQLGNNTPFYKDHTNGFGYDNKAYVLEGDSKRFWEYSADTDTWTQLDDFPGMSRRVAIGDEWDGKYYYGFGFNSGAGYLTDLWVFDPADMSFTELPSCPCIGRTHPAFIAYNDKIFMGTGTTSNGDIDDWWEYDMITQEWEQKPSMPGGPRHHPFFFESGDYVYAGGGHVNNWLQYDPVTEEWTAIDNDPAGRVAGTQLSYQGLGLLVGGDDTNHNHVPDEETFMMYDPSVEEWAYLPPLPNGSRWAPSSFIIDHTLYFFGGRSFVIEEDVTVWKFDLSSLGCLPPSDLEALNITDNSAWLFWASSAQADLDTLKWREVGSADWNIIPDADVVYTLEDLEACQDYEFQVISECSSENANSEIFTFTTDGCCFNPPLLASSIETNSIQLEWDNLLGAQNFDIRWREVGDANWTTVNTLDANFELTDLDYCTEYECQIKSICAIEDIDFGESFFFLTKGCGACTDIDFCPVYEDLSGNSIYINKVEIDGYVNESGSDQGYGDFVIPDPETINLGETFTISIETPSSASWAKLIVWIDFNANGVFEESEKVVAEQFISQVTTRDVTIPATAETGITRMRIVCAEMTGPVNPCQIPNASIVDGEAEDYCINIANPTSVVDPLEKVDYNITVYPNPSRDVIQLKSDLPKDKRYKAQVINVMGETIKQLDNFDLDNEIDLSSISSGLYFLILKNDTYQASVKVIKQ